MKTKKVSAGFDLTHLDDGRMGVTKWVTILTALKLPIKAKRVKQKDGSPGPFMWKNEKIRIITGNNPLTGKYYSNFKREPELGYASYIGITVSPVLVAKAIQLIKSNAIYIKDFHNSKRIYI